MSWQANVYSTPEKFGVRIVGEVEWTDESYEFDTTLVLRDEQGRFYVASDSGCSCPVPFEDFEGLDACVGPLTAHAVHAELEREFAGHSYRGEAEKSSVQGQIVDVMGRVMAPA